MRAVMVASLFLPLIARPPVAVPQTHPASRAPSIADWRHDVDRIAADIRLLHPDPFTRTGPLTFRRRLARLEERLPFLTEEQRVLEAMRLVASIGDGHTFLETMRSDFASWYPVRLYWFTDGLFVTSAHRSVGDLAGAEVLEIGGRSAASVLAETRDLLGADSPSGALEGLHPLHNARLMTGLGLAGAGGELTLRVRLRDGRVMDRTLHPGVGDSVLAPERSTFEWRFQRETRGPPFGSPDDWVSAYRALPLQAFDVVDSTRPAHLASLARYTLRAMPAHDAVYARMDILDDAFLPFLDSVMRQVERQRPRRLILDWRFNFGGDGSIVSAMAGRFIRRAADPPWRELYVLIGRRTFSAAIMAVNALMEQVPFTIVGEPSGSPRNHYGDATARTYPRTGLRLHVSTRWWQLSASDDLRESLPVDVAAPFSGADYLGGRDPAVDPILRGDEMRSIPVIALDQGGAAARAAFEDRARRFAGYTWWQPPQEGELKRPCQALRGLGRYADALEVCSLNAELHPYDWSAWYNLGYAQRQAGRNWSAWLPPDQARRGADLQVAGLSSYRCIEIVDPEKFDAEGFRAFLAEQDPELKVGPPTGCPAR
jgi:hypothetical protein